MGCLLFRSLATCGRYSIGLNHVRCVPCGGDTGIEQVISRPPRHPHMHTHTHTTGRHHTAGTTHIVWLPVHSKTHINDVNCHVPDTRTPAVQDEVPPFFKDIANGKICHGERHAACALVAPARSMVPHLHAKHAPFVHTRTTSMPLCCSVVSVCILHAACSKLSQ